MTDDNSIEIKMVNLLTNEEVLRNAKPLLELGIDKLADSKLIDNLPIISAGFAVGRSFLQVRDYLFARKVLHFLAALNKIPSEKRSSFLMKLSSRKSKAKVGILLLELIDKSNTEYKATILGSLFREYILKQLNYTDFVRIAEMIISAYSSDLTYFLDKAEMDIGETGDEVEHLLALGFYEREKKRFGETIMSNVQPTLSIYGKKIKQTLATSQ